MPTESEIKLSRYSEVLKAADAVSRVIGVRRLKPSEQTKIAGMTPELNGYDEMTNDKGERVRIPHRMPLNIAASVCYISDSNGEVHVPFPRNRGELDAIYDRLDIEGLKTAGELLTKLLAPATTVDGTPVDPIDTSKNL